MDRYLYKAKKIKDRQWIEGYLIYSFTGVPFIVTEYDHILALVARDEVDPSTICKCTGLKDKNGKLIWENDIVKINNSKVNTLITFRDFEIICTIPREKYYKHRLEYTTEYEVVGNIFDNPKLLESEEQYDRE